MKPRVLMLTLGGTIAMTSGATGGATPRLNSSELIASVPQLAEFASIDAQSFRQIPGAHLGFDDLSALAAAIRQASATGTRGVVVVQGTDTIEETAFALDRLLDISAPVVVTGAMRNASLPGADGPANLLAAAQVAASEEVQSIGGCVVVMSDEIHAARFVRKVHTSRISAFASPQSGPIGWIVEGRVRITHRPARIPALLASETVRPTRVALLNAGLGEDGYVVDTLRDRVDGIVIQATGGGHVSPDLADALERACARIPVVLSSRCLAGEVLSDTYGFTGGEIDLLRRGVVRSGWLDGVKSRMLLTLLLRRAPYDREAVAAAFSPYGGSALSEY